jgi:hypothetical protein
VSDLGINQRKGVDFPFQGRMPVVRSAQADNDLAVLFATDVQLAINNC